MKRFRSTQTQHAIHKIGVLLVVTMFFQNKIAETVEIVNIIDPLMFYVQVWMDEWRDFYYSMNPGARNVEIGDLSPRKKLREELKEQRDRFRCVPTN